MAGFANGGVFSELLKNESIHNVISRVAEIEQADANACAQCGGEDCVCCSIYNDRMSWDDPVDFFDSLEYEFC